MVGRSRWLIFGIVMLILTGIITPVYGQAISLTVQAGYDGLFRENQWLPVYIQASNDGPAVEGRLLVRPETSGNAITNTFSLPISLPEGSRKGAVLYITARSFATQIRIELMTNGVVVAAQNAGLRAIQPQDQLYVFISGATAGAIDWSGVRTGGNNAFQANWSLDNLPERAAALTAVDRLIFNDVDTGTLSTGQRQAVANWVAQGGQLLVTGGTSWQATAAGLTDLLPLRPDDSATVSNLTPLAEWVWAKTKLDQPTVIATGALQPEAQVLVQVEDKPLIARRTWGSGTVDYLTFDPNAQPVRGWRGLTDLWFALASSVAPQSAWQGGIYDWEQAVNAANIMPGVNLLPDILPLCGFLSIYIALIGPLNYLILNRLNRRELAWLTIPLLIIVFSGLSWLIGSNLRGNDVTISRTAVIQSWPEADQALVEEMLGLLSPRRDQYSLDMMGDSLLRPVSGTENQGLALTGNAQVSADVQQAGFFRAANFPVDASFIAAFNATTFTAKPDISGQARLFYDGPEGQQVLRGSVRNDTNQTLNDPVILARGTSLQLETALEPGAVVAFDLTLPGEGLPAPAPMAYAPGGFTPLMARSYIYRSTVPPSLNEILKSNASERAYSRRSANDSVAEQEAYRRQLFLSAFVNDPYNLTSGRGNRVYLAGWTNEAPIDIELAGPPWKALDTTLYLVELEVEFERPSGVALVPAELFTWTTESPAGFDNVAPFSLSLEVDTEATFRYTPLPEMVLRDVQELIINLDRNATTDRTIPVQIWNWQNGDWEELALLAGTQHIIRDPAPYLGPQNAVQLRVTAEGIGNFQRIRDLTVEQRGLF